MSRGKHQEGKTGAGEPINAEVHALKIAVDVARAWHRDGGPDRPEVPLGVVATVAVAGLGSSFEVDRSQVEFVRFARRVWAQIFSHRPDLVRPIAPMMGWLVDGGDGLGDRITSVADAAVGAGLLRLVATERRFDADLLGPVLGALRSPSSTRINAQMYTPGDIACALTAVVLDDIRPDQTFCDDTVGTGGLFRAAAQVIRGRGLDPADMTWCGADIDTLAIAATAVNSLIWQLGSRIVLYVGDPIANADWPAEAAQQRAVLIDLAGKLQAAATALDFVRRV